MAKKKAATTEELSEYQKARQTIEDAKKVCQKVLKDELVRCAEKLFEAHPEIESFSWTQYTPGFNDGDPCTFGVHADDPQINGEEPDWENPLRQKISKLVFSFDEEDHQQAFGDGVRVTVKRDGKIEVEDYDCGY